MIVRTYGRRNRGIDGSYSGTDDEVSDGGFKDSLSQETPPDIYSFAFSSQDSSPHWSFDSDPFAPSNSSQESRQLPLLPPRKPPARTGDSENAEEGFRKSKKARIGKRELDKSKKSKNLGRAVSMVTLMETQEFGEMMEHMDEVNFALDGLRKGQPARIRRASLFSLLSICGTAHQRRLLRVHGMAKTIIDAVLGLSFDDSPSNLAAAALFYILTSDSQDDHLMDSPSCIRFLIKLLKPPTRDGSKDKETSIGCKLLAIRKDADILHDTAKGVDSTSAAIMLKVEEILVSCKEIKSRDDKDNGTRKPEISPKWISLLTMEKACVSTIAIEDTSGTVRRTGGNFKENLRELGGLDEVFEVARNCHTIMEGWLKQNSASTRESKDKANLECLILLLKSLKILENATFLSKNNQDHLLGMKGSFESPGSPRSFTKLIICVIKILSDLSLINSYSAKPNKEGVPSLSNGTGHASEMTSQANVKVYGNEIIPLSSSLSSSEWTTSQKSLTFSEDNEWLSETTTTSLIDNCLLKMRVNSSTSGSSTGTSRGSNSGMPLISNGLKMTIGLGKRAKVTEDTKFDLLEDSQDPFAFDEDDFEPSKWDLLSGKEKVVQTLQSRGTYQNQDRDESLLISSQQESSNVENHHSQDVSCSSAVDEEKSNLLAECLLTSVKVLMNLTNDNPEGCQQIAKFGGLETLSSLIAVHFPSFSSPLPPFNEINENALSSNSSVELVHQKDRNLTDQELDFLVAILGLLVNLVEKDSRNRSRLASTSVSLPSLGGSTEESCKDVIPLLCSIFLANQGAGEAAGEERALTWDDEEALLQGEKEAEKMIVEAYAALLLAFLSTESQSIRKDIVGCLPDHNLATLVPVLERFVEFHLTLNMISPETHTTVLEVIESCRVP